ncbi:MAG TPA: DUF4388 domain-containing protein [Pyrinomonadaceae bacterium]|jgi:hypothetical protein
MSLTGQLSDLSLAELIEFFCNQRKTGRLKVAYERAPGYFYFERGDLVDAKIGSLNGVEAIYYSLTLANASFKFSESFPPERRTIHQPWVQVALEGLRRLDEGIKPSEPEMDCEQSAPADPELMDEGVRVIEEEQPVAESAEAGPEAEPSAMPLSMTVGAAASGGKSRVMVYGAVVAAIIGIVAVIGVPAGWYNKSKPRAVAAEPAARPAEQAVSASSESPAGPAEAQAETAALAETGAPVDAPVANDPAALAARRAREARDRERALAAQERASAAKQSATVQPPANANPDAARKPEPPKQGPKMVSVQVSYDEAGRVTQISGGDGTAQRIARQKRFPAGKAGTTTVTIPLN